MGIDGAIGFAADGATVGWLAAGGVPAGAPPCWCCGAPMPLAAAFS
jgi:hypothetical protein